MMLHSSLLVWTRAAPVNSGVRWLPLPKHVIACECDQLPTIFSVGTYPNALMNHIELVDRKDGGWLKLYECSICGRYWQVDVIDRLQTNCAIRIDDRADWQSFDDKPMRVQYLINSRGGLSDEECIMAGCKNKALTSLSYCPKHAYEDVGLRE